MKLISREQKKQGLTRIDVLVVVVTVVTLLFATAVPILVAAHRRAERINCIANLRQLGGALSPLEDEIGITNDNRSAHGPWMSLLETNAQTVGLNAGQVAWINAMKGCSNALTSSKILQCPADKETPITTGPTGLKIRISYYLNLDANEGYPQQIMAGDDNLSIGGVPIKPGIFELTSNAPVSWSDTRHIRVGNILLCDGSVDQVSSSSLQNAAAYSFPGTPYATNRVAIP
ncbi:MAG TPA: hypothetical protein VGY56_16830 [Verrucomicrobiae bacterium]|nr:hypothetical protein [Verrucomicrobiae bacterium]